LSITKKFGFVNALFTTGKAVEDDAVSNTDAGDTAGDININFLVLNTDIVKTDAASFPLEIGFYQGTDSNATTASDNNTLVIYDLRAGANLLNDSLKFGLEFAMNDGQQNGGDTSVTPAGPRDYTGSAMLLHANYDNKEAGFGAHLRYANATGDDQNGSAAEMTKEDEAFHDFRTLGWKVSDYRYGEILSNDNTFAAATGLGAGLDTGALGNGLNIINVGGYYTLPWNDRKWNVGADIIMAKVNEASSGADDGIGTEFDIAVNYAHNANVLATLGYAMLDVDEGLRTGFTAPTPGANVDTDSVTKLFAKLHIRWGNMENAAY